MILPPRLCNMLWALFHQCGKLTMNKCFSPGPLSLLIHTAGYTLGHLYSRHLHELCTAENSGTWWTTGGGEKKKRNAQQQKFNFETHQPSRVAWLLMALVRRFLLNSQTQLTILFQFICLSRVNFIPLIVDLPLACSCMNHSNFPLKGPLKHILTTSFYSPFWESESYFYSVHHFIYYQGGEWSSLGNTQKWNFDTKSYEQLK